MKQTQPLEKLYQSTEGVVSIVAQVALAVASIPAIGALRPAVGGASITVLALAQLLQRGALKMAALKHSAAVQVALARGDQLIGAQDQTAALQKQLDVQQGVAEAQAENFTPSAALAPQDTVEQPLADDGELQAVTE